jgi:hypothetical protein
MWCFRRGFAFVQFNCGKPVANGTANWISDLPVHLRHAVDSQAVIPRGRRCLTMQNTLNQVLFQQPSQIRTAFAEPARQSPIFLQITGG